MRLKRYLEQSSSPLSTEMEFELNINSKLLVSNVRRKKKQQLSAPFASITAASPKEPINVVTPIFTIAAAATKPSHSTAATAATKWRVTAGNLAAGAIAGASVEAILYPIDTIKTRLQAMKSGGGIRALLQSGGGRALYAGIWGNLAGVAPASAIFMAVYEPVKAAATKMAGPDKEFMGPLAGGVAAGLASSIVRVPTEVVKTRMQTKEFNNALTALKTIALKEGSKGLFAGYGSFLLRDLPFDAIEFVTYEQLKKVYKVGALRDGRELNPGEHSVCGAMAGAVTGLVTTPLDVLKTRLMLQGGSRAQYANAADCAVKIVRQEGWGALFRGWEPRVIWIGVGGSVFFTVLEQAKKAFAPKPPVKPCCSGKSKNSNSSKQSAQKQ